MAILELLLRQVYASQECINRFHYISTGTPAAVSLSFALTSAFGVIPDGIPPAYPVGAPFAQIMNIQNPGVTYIEVQTANLYSETDFYTRPFVADTHGGYTGEAQSPTLAYGLFSSRVSRAIRRGYKRFVGVIAADAGNEGNLSATGLAGLTELATRLSATLSYDDEGNVLSFAPAILSFEKYTTPTGRTAYKPYATEAAQLTHSVTGISYAAYDRVRTQTSRQYGRGK